MAPTTLELDGLMSFQSYPKESFRFMLTLKDDKLSIWLENRKSKKQWQSGFLGLDEFVSSDNSIPGAKLGEYAEWIQTALEAADDVKDPSTQRKLLDDTDGTMRLEVVVNFKVLRSVWSPAYAFTMKAIPIERIDIAESRLFDVEQSLKRVEREKRSMTVTQATTENVAAVNQAVTWIASLDALFVIEGTEICAREAGVFLAVLAVYHSAPGHSTVISLLNSGARVCGSYVPCVGGNQSATTDKTFILQLKEGDKLSLVGNSVSILGGTMTMTKLGS